MLLLPVVNYSSCFSPPPFPSAISTTELYSRPLQIFYFEVHIDTKHAWYGSFSFRAATKPFHAKQQTVHGTHKKSMKYTTTLWSAHTCLRKTTRIHHYISISTKGNLHLKSVSTLQKLPRRGVIYIILHFGNRTISCKLLGRLCIVAGTHTKGMKHTNVVRCIDVSQQNSMHTSQHQ